MVASRPYDRLASETGILGISNWRFSFPLSSRIFKSFVSETVCLAMLDKGMIKKEKKKRSRDAAILLVYFNNSCVFLVYKVVQLSPKLLANQFL